MKVFPLLERLQSAVVCAVVLVACSQQQPGTAKTLEISLCYEFSHDISQRSIVSEYFEELAVEFNGKMLTEPQMVYFKLRNEEYYIEYTDRKSAFGNLLLTFGETSHSDEINSSVKFFLSSKFSEVKDCTPYFHGSTSAYDF